jgi:hypothetical protein
MTISPQAGAIVFRSDGHSVQVLLVRAKKKRMHPQLQIVVDEFEQARIRLRHLPARPFDFE